MNTTEFFINLLESRVKCEQCIKEPKWCRVIAGRWHVSFYGDIVIRYISHPPETETKCLRRIDYGDLQDPNYDPEDTITEILDHIKQMGKIN
jgi:hypothetical protein